MMQRHYFLRVPGQYTSWLALMDPVKGREGWEALDISYRDGEIIPSITFLAVGPCDIAPYNPITVEAYRDAARRALDLVQAAFEVATEKEVTA